VRRGALALVVVLIAGLVTINSSCLAPRPTGPPKVLAHRGVHQVFSMDGVDGTTCTAKRIDAVTHPFLENTLPGIQAAIDAGAEAVEVDVHATLDGHLAVFHDATLDCRTDGSGRSEDHTLAELRGLDLGYGYTADGGTTYPLRGSGTGLLVTLPEVLEAFPSTRFVIDIKGGDAGTGDLVVDALTAAGRPSRHVVYGAPAAVGRVRERLPGLTTFDRPRAKACLKGYIATGWLGRMPRACRDTWVLVPTSHRWLVWGFPRRFEARLGRHGSEAVLIGPLADGHGTGIDDLSALAAVPDDFGGWIWTDRVEVIGGALSDGASP